ncbi:tetraspanin-32 isoform X3 [Rhinolophus ferrumequinum]|uniref:tetraspanin-32 isoform X3 n=1 Tax=Rhinolophus ferrumequinum TaxID=59479 RepID=UPI00140F687D|nr:tetraspanin-32 isoform X3 [Rhinolophus ferrumequinum]
MPDAGHQCLCLLGLFVASMAALTYFGAHFAVIGHASPEDTPYEAMHRWLFYAGIGLAGLLTLGAVLSAIATVREAGCLMAGGFLCFALVFCVLTQMAFWRFHNPAQVEDAVLDIYDLVYEQAVKNPSGTQWQELLAIQDTFLCCGKRTPSSLLGSSEADLCLGEQARRQDCLQGIRSFLRTHGHIASTLASVGLASMVYAMLLSSFLCFAIRSGRSLDRKGTYTLSPRHPTRPLHILEQPQSICFSEPVAASPRSPASSDASRRNLHFITCPKQVLCMTVWAQADARMALGCSRTTDTVVQPPVLPPVHPQRRRRPGLSPHVILMRQM